MWNSPSIKARNKPQKNSVVSKKTARLKLGQHRTQVVNSGNWSPNTEVTRPSIACCREVAFDLSILTPGASERERDMWYDWYDCRKTRVPTSFSFSRKSRPKLPAVFRLFPPLKFHICWLEIFWFTSWVAFVILLDRGLHKRTQKICMNFFQNPSIHLLLKHFNRFNSSNQDPPWDRCQESVASLGVSTPPQDAPPAAIKTTWYYSGEDPPIQKYTYTVYLYRYTYLHLINPSIHPCIHTFHYIAWYASTAKRPQRRSWDLPLAPSAWLWEFHTEIVSPKDPSRLLPKKGRNCVSFHLLLDVFCVTSAQNWAKKLLDLFVEALLQFLVTSSGHIKQDSAYNPNFTILLR